MWTRRSGWLEARRLPAAAKAERARDRRGLPAADPGIDAVVEAAVEWIGRAQDAARPCDGGVARHYSLVGGWAPSYPETTGYIVPTMLRYAQLRGRDEPRERARRMLEWLVAIQMEEGGFQAGVVGAEPRVPTIFNTGQILMGLAAGASRLGDERYHRAMERAGDWLVRAQDADGCWRRFPSPFTAPGEKVYETHVAWGLLEAARVAPMRGYAEAALANVQWALGHQRENGWFDRCCLTDPQRPLTHTLGYALRGVVEAYRYSREAVFLKAARRTADGLLDAMDEDGHLAGRLDAKWQGAVEWACLTGTVQIAASWLLLYEETRDSRYLKAARVANRYVRRTMCVDGPAEVRGGVKGSFPVDGAYGRYEYLNWACKFLIDACLLEEAARDA